MITSVIASLPTMEGVPPRRFILFFLIASAFYLVVALTPQTASASALYKAPNNLGLQGYWSFEDGKLSKATDFSGKGNAGTLTNMEEADWVQGKVGRALSFDGVDEYVSAGNAAALQTTGNLTIAAWIKLASQPAADTNAFQIISKDKNTGGRAYAFDYYNLAGSKHLRFYVNGGAGADKLEGTTTLSTGTWYHVAATYSTGGVITLYINGAQEAQGSGAATSIPSATANVTIGAREYSGFEDYFNGSIDEARIYNRTLTATEVAALYSQTGGVKITNNAQGLRAYYPMGEGAGTTISDATGNRNTGTFGATTAAPTWSSGKFGNGLTFDGTADYVNLTSASALNPTSAITISAWINASGGAGTYREAIGRWDTVGGVNERTYVFGLDSSNKFRFQTSRDGTDATAVAATEASAQTTGVWYHYVGTWDGATLLLYRNGVQVATASQSAMKSSPNTRTSIGGLIGRSGDTTGSLFPGIIDDVRIYNRALSAQEVSNLYGGSGQSINVVNSSQNTQLTSGLVGMWDFNGPRLSGTALTDASGNGVSGTLTNGPVPDLGVVGQGLSFDGSNDYVTMGDALSLNGAQARTLSTWVKFRSDPLTRAEWFIERGNSTNATYWLWWNGDNSFSLGDNTLICGHRNSSGVGEQIANTWTPAANVWYHVACVYTTSQLIEYINGVQLGSPSSFSGSIADETSSARTLRLGQRIATGGSVLDGWLDEVRIYSRALTAAEMLSLYNQGK